MQLVKNDGRRLRVGGPAPASIPHLVEGAALRCPPRMVAGVHRREHARHRCSARSLRVPSGGGGACGARSSGKVPGAQRLVDILRVRHVPPTGSRPIAFKNPTRGLRKWQGRDALTGCYRVGAALRYLYRGSDRTNPRRAACRAHLTPLSRHFRLVAPRSSRPDARTGHFPHDDRDAFPTPCRSRPARRRLSACLAQMRAPAASRASGGGRIFPIERLRSRSNRFEIPEQLAARRLGWISAGIIRLRRASSRSTADADCIYFARRTGCASDPVLACRTLKGWRRPICHSPRLGPIRARRKPHRP